MKLLYCIPALYNAGGMERVISEKANYLVNLPNYEISIVTTDQNGRDLRFPLDNRINLVHLNINFDGHYSENLLKKYFLHQKKTRIYKQKLVQLIKELEVDICISLCGKEIDFLADLPVKCKKIGEIHFSMNYRKQFLTARHKGYIWSFLGEIRTQQLKKVTERLDSLVVLTRADQMQWQQSHNNIILIPNPNPLNDKLVSILQNNRVISVGKLDAQKGYDMLIDIWALVAVKHPEWVLDIFGIGEWEQMLLGKIKELKLESSIHLCGSAIDVTSQYIESSIYVMSSRYEGFGMVLVEAMSCGLPVVSFDCEYGPGEIIYDGINGFLIKPNNIRLFAEKICTLIENENLRKAMGNKALESVERYAKETIMQKWIGLFQKTV